MSIDSIRSIQNAMKHTDPADPIVFTEDDLEVYDTEHNSGCATVVMIDISLANDPFCGSMVSGSVPMLVTSAVSVCHGSAAGAVPGAHEASTARQASEANRGRI